MVQSDGHTPSLQDKSTSHLCRTDLQTIDLEENFGVRLVGIERPKTERNLIGLKQTQYSVIDKITGDLRVEEGDLLILFGKMEVLHRLAISDAGLFFLRYLGNQNIIYTGAVHIDDLEFEVQPAQFLTGLRNPFPEPPGSGRCAVL